ncbi:MAG: carboxypeptidase regulatory-like domain-containing protein [Chloroflexi bacterium]|nr:carboxypeptidase regulatory-like domain-containing protein [Chloroflexota bacterium]
MCHASLKRVFRTALLLLLSVWILASASNDAVASSGAVVPNGAVTSNEAEGIIPTSNTAVTPYMRQGIDHVNLMDLSISTAELEKRYNLAQGSGAAWTRWALYWNRVESNKGYDFSLVDAIVSADVAHGLSSNAILLGTPDNYATGGSPQLPMPAPGPYFNRPRSSMGAQLSSATSPPANLNVPIFADGTDKPGLGKSINPQNYWARFVYQAVNRYRPGGDLARSQHWPDGTGVRTWEIWNEPDLNWFWSGSVNDYARLLKVGYLAAKTADPQATILIAGMAHFSQPDFFPNLLQALSQDSDKNLRDSNNWFFDVTAWHLYSDPRLLWDKTQWIRSQLARFGLGNKPIWVNESGIPVWNDYPGPTWDPNSPGRGTLDEQAAYVIQAYAYAFAAGIDRTFIFQLFDDCGNGPDSHDAFGIIRNPAGSACWSHPSAPDVPRPAYQAFQMVADQLRDLTFLSRNTQGNIERLAFSRSQGQRVTVLWNWNTTDRTVNISATSPTATAYFPGGGPLALSASNGQYAVTLPGATNHNAWSPTGGVMVGGRPIILVEGDGIAPTSHVEPLPPYSLATFTVRWSGTDIGSGIANYDVYYSDGPPSPTNNRIRWFSATTATSAQFTGEVGHTYYFAARARDNAGNVETFPAMQTWTTVVASLDISTIIGTVKDNRDGPVPDATVQAWIPAFNPKVTNTTDTGGFTFSNLKIGQEYQVLATKPGAFGTWAPMRITTAITTPVSITLNLPPEFNLIQNGDFEDRLGNWQTSGSTPVVATNALSLAGHWSALLGANFQGQADLGGIGNSTLSQSADLSASASRYTLSFDYKLVGTEQEYGHDWFEVLLIADGEVCYLTGNNCQAAPNLWQSRNWTHLWFDLARWKGKHVQVMFNVRQESAARPTIVYLDQVALEGAPPRDSLTHAIYLPFGMR